MTNITFFFLLIPFLALALLMVNFIFATHTPYQEKNSTFECGFHSFLGQNRMQFNISFYIFGLLFLLFDLEILLIYPYPVSAQFNSVYGLIIMIIFFLILTLGFTFELGKNALKIDSRQYNNNDIIYKLNNNNNNNKNKLLTSSLFENNKRKDLYISIISWFITLICFTTISKIFINLIYDTLTCLILSLVITILAGIIKFIIKYCFDDNDDKLKNLANNKIKFFIYTVLPIIIIMIIIRPFIIYGLSYDILPNFIITYAMADLLLNDDYSINPRWIHSYNHIQRELNRPDSRMNEALFNAKEHDKALTNCLKEADRLENCESRDLLDTMDLANGARISATEFKKFLDQEFSTFKSCRGDLKKSALRLKGHFESLPDKHPRKKYFLNRMDEKLEKIVSLGGDLKNKRIYPGLKKK